MAESVSLGAAHVEFTGDFASLMDGINHAVKISVEATTTINLALQTTEKQVQRSNKSIIRSYADLNRQVRSYLRGITSELVFLQLDISHIANQVRNMTLAIAAAMGGAAAASISFEDAFAGVRKTVDASETEFRALEQSIRRMSTQTRTSANDLAVIMGVAGQLGIRGVDNLTAFTRTVDQLTIATNLTREQGAQDLARLMNIMQESMGNVDRLGAAIVDLGNNFAATESEIISMALRIAGAGKTVGLTTQDVLGLATALSDVGIRAEMGGSAISRVMINMANAVSQGGSRLREFARVANMTTQQFAETFRRDPIQALQAFIDGLERLDRQGQNVFAILEDVGASEIRVRDTLLRLFQASDRLADAVRRANEAWEENTALTEEVRKRNETAVSQLRIALNNVVEIARIVGDEYNPVVKEAAQFTTTLAQALHDMTPQQKAAVAEFVTLSAAILGGITAALLATKAFITFGTGIVLLTRAVAALLSPWGLATVAIVTAAVVIAAKWDEIVEKIKSSNLGQLATQAWEDFKAVWTDEKLTLPPKIIASVSIATKTVGGLIGSIAVWWLRQTIKLARKTVEFVGLDPDENALVQFLEKIRTWLENEELTTPEKWARILGISLGMDDETQQQLQDQVRESIKQLKEDFERIWSEEFGEEWRQALKRAHEEGRIFDPITVFVESVTETVQAFRRSLEPIRRIIREWQREEFSLAEAFQRGMEQGIEFGIDPRTIAAVQSLIDLGSAIGDLLEEFIAANFDVLELIVRIFVTPLARVVHPLMEVGAQWAGAIWAGFVETWGEFETWFKNTPLGKWLINLGILEPASQTGAQVVPQMPGLVESFQFAGLQEILDAIYRAEGGERAVVPYGMTDFAARGNRFARPENQELFEMLQLVYGLQEGTREFYEAAAAVSVMHYWRTFKEKFPEVGERTFAELNAEMQRLFIEHLGAGFAPSSAHSLNANWVPNVLSILGIPGHRKGVILPGYGGGDRIPALLEAGEAVVPADVVRGGLADIVAWFRSMGVRKMQAGGIAGITTLGEAEEQLILVGQDVNQFANTLLSGIEQITDSLATFLFGGLQMIADVLKVMFPDHAETIQSSLENLREWWQRTFTPRQPTQEEVKEEARQAAEAVETVGPVTATLILPEGLRRLLDIMDYIEAQAAIARVTGEEFDALNTEIRMVRQAIREMAEAAGHIPPEAQVLIDRLRELERQTEQTRIKQSAWTAAFDTLTRRLNEVDPALGAIARAIQFDASGFRGFDMATLAAEGVAFALNTLIDVFDTGASQMEATVARIRSLDVGTDVLAIAETYRNFQEVDKNRRAAIAEAERLRQLQQQIDTATAVGAVGGAAAGAAIGTAILPGVGTLLGALIGGLAGGSAARTHATRNYADDIAEAEAKIRNLESLIEGARVKLIDALGIAADSFASGIQAAIDRASIKGILDDAEAFGEFSKNLETAIDQVIRRGMITKFMATVLEPQITTLAEHVQTALLGGGDLDVGAIRAIRLQIEEHSKALFRVMDEFDLLAESTEQVNRQFERLVNVPLGRRVLQALRFESATPATLPSFAGGGVMPYDGLAYLHRGELVLTPEQQDAALGGGGDIHLHFHGPVYGLDDFNRRIEGAVMALQRRDGLRRYGNPTALERVRR